MKYDYEHVVKVVGRLEDEKTIQKIWKASIGILHRRGCKKNKRGKKKEWYQKLVWLGGEGRN